MASSRTVPKAVLRWIRDKAQLRYGANRPIGVRKEHLDSSHLVSIVHVVHPARDELVEPPVRHP